MRRKYAARAVIALSCGAESPPDRAIDPLEALPWRRKPQSWPDQGGYEAEWKKSKGTQACRNVGRDALFCFGENARTLARVTGATPQATRPRNSLLHPLPPGQAFAAQTRATPNKSQRRPSTQRFGRAEWFREPRGRYSGDDGTTDDPPSSPKLSCVHYVVARWPSAWLA
jgi:hypothetical protein